MKQRIHDTLIYEAAYIWYIDIRSSLYDALILKQRLYDTLIYEAAYIWHIDIWSSVYMIH